MDVIELAHACTQNWVYGAKSPDIEYAASEAIAAAHRYRNRLCELELAKRARHYELLRKLAPTFVAAEKAVEDAEKRLADIRAVIQDERVSQRTKKPVGIDHIVQQAADVKAALKDLRSDRKTAKLAAYGRKTISTAMDKNSAQHKAECAEAKQNSGLYWGTEATVRGACGSFASGAPPRSKRYDGTGQLAVQLQGGLDCADAERYNTLCYLGEPIDHRKRWCFIRVASEGRSPVFARVPIVFHRPLPAGAIKWAYLERRKVADHVRWSIRMTIDVMGSDQTQVLPGAVAIHTGWRMEGGSLRVATWLGSDGERGCLRLNNEHCEDYAKLAYIRSQRDLKFNGMIERVRSWLQDRDLPDWLSEATSHIPQWKSSNRLDDLAWRMHAHPTEGDSDIAGLLTEWRQYDKHAWQHERRLAVRVVRRRKNAFRNFAAMLSKRYGVAIVSPIDAKDLTENSQPEELERDNTQAHRHGKWAAVSDLTQCIREKFPLRCIDVSPVNITRECINCGHVNDRSNSFRIQCRGCGVTYDIDANAVGNTLARGEVLVKSGVLLDLVTAQEVKVAKRQERLAKMQEANRGARRRKELANES